MQKQAWPRPPSHGTFQFGGVTIDSNFDGGNCSNAEKVNGTSFSIWIGSDHPQNNYRTWFHFSIVGFSKGTQVTFKIRNMQNQSRLLLEGIAPVYRQQSQSEWKRVAEKINTTSIQYYDGWIEWQFKHTFTSTDKVFLAFWYPWSLTENNKFLQQIREKIKGRDNVYFHRTTITQSLQGRPIQLITISSNKSITNKQQKIQDSQLFSKNSKPKAFRNKKGLVITARVHPGEVPGSHVLVGIMKALTEESQLSNSLLDQFVFYIIPFLNPDGVYRGHYRADTRGINLNRYYINPSPSNQSSIYAVKKLILHLHSEGNFYAFLDLHAHAGRKGMFIYGNAVNELQKQIDVCLFPKLLSLNSEDFEYQGSNFTEKNMYCKDKADSISKQGSGRVAIFKATKNAKCWTLQCNYNASRTLNVLEPKNTEEPTKKAQIDKNIIVPQKNTNRVQAKGFYTIETYHKLGKEICESLLDLVNKNPQSRVENQKNYFKSLENMKLNLAVALLRMAPNRFESTFKKIYYGLCGENEDQALRSLKALQLLIIMKAKIENINSYIKDKNDDTVVLPEAIKVKKKSESLDTNLRNIRITKVGAKAHKEPENLEAKNPPDDAASFDSGEDSIEKNEDTQNTQMQMQNTQMQKLDTKKSFLMDQKLSISKVFLKMEEIKLTGTESMRASIEPKSAIKSSIKIKSIRFRLQQIPTNESPKPAITIASLANTKLSKINSAKDSSNVY